LEIQGCFEYTLLYLHTGFLIFKMYQYDDNQADEMELSSTPPMKGCYDDILEEYERDKYVPTRCKAEAQAQLRQCIAYYNANVEHAKNVQEMLLMIVDAKDELELYNE
jgi:hypothetical protein